MDSGCGLSWRGGGCVSGGGNWANVDVGLAMPTIKAAATAEGPPAVTEALPAATETISAAACAASELTIPVGVVPLVPNGGFAMCEEPDDESHDKQRRHHDGSYLPARQWGVTCKRGVVESSERGGVVKHSRQETVRRTGQPP